MFPSIKKEFKLRNFCLNYEHPYHFYTSTVEKTKHFYLVWRIFWFLFHCAGIIAIFIHTNTPYLGKLFAFATIQGYLFLTITTLLDLIFVILFQYKWPTSRQDKHQDAMPWYFKINWFLSNIAYNGAFFITLIYWILLYKAGRNLGINIVEHAMTSVYTFLNIFVTNKPTRLLHFWHTLIWMITYLIFLGIYYVSGVLHLITHQNESNPNSAVANLNDRVDWMDRNAIRSVDSVQKRDSYTSLWGAGAKTFAAITAATLAVMLPGFCCDL
ncbi:unnamed protein product [Acanthosepion pharaonis]|uniref:Uncharacterized protein n=1 Tax=Acanthosepion pharaonis TaxID=158019 RepID=A0A812BRR5_ACAPH|nr:unnamed protein product [Sepia pharaonis]